MKSSISTTGASPSVAPPTRSFNVLLADGSRLRVTSRDLAAQLRQERSATLKRLRQARAEALADVADRISEARIRREFEAGEREMDAAIRRLSKMVRVKPEPRRRSASPRSSPSTQTKAGHARIVFTQRTASALARRDRLGREGIMLHSRYVRAGGKHASPGCLRRHYRYIARLAAVTRGSDGEPIVLGNMGATDDEVANALDLQEQVLRGMRKNAKLGFRMIGAFPYGLPVDARRKVLQRLGEELFGARDLPWTAAAHDADPGAKVDNPHFHLDYGLLPMAQQPDGSVIVSNDLRTDLDGQDGLRFIRHSVARVMTEVAYEYGLDRRFTALSYRERGMNHEGGEHVGQEGTAAHRRGEHVAAIARNEAKQRLGEARQKLKRARERVDALERLKRAIRAISAAPSVADDLRPSEAAAALATSPTAMKAFHISALPAVAPEAFIIPAILPPDPAPLAVAAADGPAVTLTTAPPTGTIPPAFSDFAPAPDRDAAPNVPMIPGPRAPATESLPVIIATRYPPPRVAAVVLPDVDMPAAPSVDAVPAPAEIGRSIGGTAPPCVIPLGSPIPHSASAAAAPTRWAIGRKAATDPVDGLTEEDLADAIARDEERHRLAQTGRTARTDSSRPAWAASDEQRPRRPLEELLRAIAEERHFLKREDDVVVVEPRLLTRFGLSQADIAGEAARRSLSDLADGQAAEVSQIATHVRASPHELVPDGDGWQLADAAPAEIRLLVAAWRNDATMQHALGRAVMARPVAERSQNSGQPAAEPVGAAWRRARLARERAMTVSDALERRDGNGLPQPGRRTSRPGTEEIDNPAHAARRFPGQAGRGVGD